LIKIGTHSSNQIDFRQLEVYLKNVVRIDGGLGSQMLCWMFYIIRKEHNQKTKVDVSFFNSERKIESKHSQPPARPWELHNYGIDLSSVKASSVKYRPLFNSYEKIFKENRPFFETLVNRNWNETFPIVEGARTLLAGGIGLIEQDFCVVHLRRGDFLHFSSKIVDLSTVLKLCESIKLLLPPTIIFVSDDPFTTHEQHVVQSQLNQHKIHFLDDIDQHICHGIMRMAKILVASNSTFSWTASLMSEKAHSLTFSPTTFSLPAHNVSNEIFRASSEWMIRNSP